MLERIVGFVGRAANVWLGRRHLKRAGLSAKELDERVAEMLKPKLVLPLGLRPDKACGTVTEHTLHGSWVGPCQPGEDQKIVFHAGDRETPFLTKRLLVTSVRAGEPKPVTLVMGRVFVGDTPAQINRRGAFELESIGSPVTFDTPFEVFVPVGVELEVEAFLQGEPLREGQSIYITVQFLGEVFTKSSREA